MLDAIESLGDLDISKYSLSLGLGNLIKAVLILFVAGPVMNRFGARQCALVTLLVLIANIAILSSAMSGTTYCIALTSLIASTAFAEQPCFVCLNASHFEVLLSVATSTIASAFSVAGALLPLLLAPLLATSGWRAVLGAQAISCVLLLPIVCGLLKPGQLRVGSMRTVPRPGTSTPDSPAAKTAAESGESTEPTDGAVADSEKRRVVSTSNDDELPTDGVSASAAFRSSTFWVLWIAVLLHLTYGSLLSAHLLTVLRTSCVRPVLTASAINSLQFLCAIAGKLLSGALLACETPATQRAISLTLFVVAPLAYCLSHLLLLDVHPAALLAADLTNGLTFAQSNARLMCYAITVGLPFGALFGTLLCLPARLFGRRDLPTLQSAIYAAILLASGLFIPLAGYLRDTYGGYQLPLLLTAGASAIEMCLLAHLMRVDARARASAATSYQEVL